MFEIHIRLDRQRIQKNFVAGALGREKEKQRMERVPEQWALDGVAHEGRFEFHFSGLDLGVGIGAEIGRLVEQWAPDVGWSPVQRILERSRGRWNLGVVGVGEIAEKWPVDTDGVVEEDGFHFSGLRIWAGGDRVAEQWEHPHSSGLIRWWPGQVQRQHIKHNIWSHGADGRRDDSICLLLACESVIAPQISNDLENGLEYWICPPP